ncbi:MAG TPA: hypothetical protein VL308_11640 [Gemmatimonadaceae bacterium]|jgi:hypothetical protein|nr:hypothetical protein [Gemmatimonadaceae bacterium]
MRILHTIRLGTALAAIGSMAAVVACGGGETPSETRNPTPAEVTLTLTLTTPNAGDGGMLFTVSGPSILGVTVRSGLEMTERTTTDNGVATSTVLVRGDLTSGPIGSITVRGADAGAAYTTNVQQVAAGASGGYAQRADLTAYRVATGQ